MPTDMNEPSYTEYSDGCPVDMQSAATTMAQIFTGQMEAYHATAEQLDDAKSLALNMSSALGHSQGAAAAIAVASAGQSPATLEAYARCVPVPATLLRLLQLTLRAACDSTLTKSMSWLGLRVAESAAPLQLTRASYSTEPFNTYPGAAPAACYGTLDDYDDVDEAPWALRFGVDPNVPPEPVAPRCGLSHLLLSCAVSRVSPSQHGGLPERRPRSAGEGSVQDQPQYCGCRLCLHRACQWAHGIHRCREPVWHLCAAFPGDV